MAHPPIANVDQSFAYYEGIACAMVILHTGCSNDEATAAVKNATAPHRGIYPVTADLCRDVILSAVAAIREAQS